MALCFLSWGQVFSVNPPKNNIRNAFNKSSRQKPRSSQLVCFKKNCLHLLITKMDLFLPYIYIYRVIGSHNSTYRVKITPSEMHWFSTIWPFIGGPIVTPSSQKPSRKYSFLAGIKRPVPKMVIGTIGTFARFAMDTGPRLNFLGVWLLFHVWKKNIREKIVKKFGRLFKNHLESRWRWFIIAPY